MNIGKVLNKDLRVILEDSDVITFYSIKNTVKSVTVEGEVNRPGQYSLTGVVTIKDLIKKAGGLTGVAHRERVDIFRKNKDKSTALMF